MKPDTAESSKVRLDKWLWAARFYKTRSLSAQDVEKGRVRLGGATVKPAREVRLGDIIEIRTGDSVRTVCVKAVSGLRGPAPTAALLYEESPESVALRAQAQAQRRLAPEPAQAQPQGRPRKRDRRELDALQRSSDPWNDRWGASLDDKT